MTDRTMGPVDTIWLNMDTPENLMVIDSLMVLDGPADWDRVSELFQKRLVEAYPSFRQRVKRPRAGIGSPHWNHDPNFLLSKHLIRHTLPDGEDSTLQRYIEEQMQIPLRQTRPLWQAHLIDGYHKGSVIYSRIHHCIADGIALNEVMLSLTEATPDGDLPAEPAAGETPVDAQPSLVAQVQDAA
ncbi:MAG: wax ester/triacylglycerol synthase domain-containing protein, partial [Gordonia amarae]